MKALSGQKWTARQLAGQFKCDEKTIRNHATKLFGGWKQGRARYFDEAQTTVILESIKQETNTGGRPTSETVSEVSLHEKIGEYETALTPILKLQLIAKQKDELHRQELEIYENETNRIKEKLAGVSRLLEHRTKGLEFYQRAAESAGLTLTDTDDLHSAYRR